MISYKTGKMLLSSNINSESTVHIVIVATVFVYIPLDLCSSHHKALV